MGGGEGTIGQVQAGVRGRVREKAGCTCTVLCCARPAGIPAGAPHSGGLRGGGGAVCHWKPRHAVQTHVQQVVCKAPTAAGCPAPARRSATIAAMLAGLEPEQGGPAAAEWQSLQPVPGIINERIMRCGWRLRYMFC